MRGAFSGAIVVAMLCVLPTAIAPPPPQAQGGLSNACQHAASNQPCVLAGIIQGGTIGPGQSQTYEDDDWRVDGTITVQSGGSLTLDNAIFRFTNESGGIIVETGGRLKIVASTLEPDGEDETTYVLDLAAGSEFTLNTTTVRAGNGVKLRTSDANVSGNSFEEIPLALFMDDVEVNIHHNQFLDNEVAINQTGGANTLDRNLFDGGEVCVRDWLTDPTITNNTFRGCHVGILHQNSASVFRANDMEDQAEPPGVGIIVENTNSPVIEGNRIANYGTGILVRNATAYIRGNEIVGNVGDGVRVEANTQPMDIQNNTIAQNGGDGVDLQNAQSVLVRNNSIHDNGGYGVVTLGTDALTVSLNDIYANGVDGIGLVNTPEALVDNNTVHDNNATGIVIGTGSAGASVADNLVGDNGQHGVFVRSDGVVVARTSANNNGLSGFAFESVSGGTLRDVEASSNGVDGFRFPGASVNATDLVALDNVGHGFVFSGDGERTLVRANASGNGGDGFHASGAGSAALEEPRALFNGGDGLNQTSGDVASASFGWWEGNAGAGVFNQEPDVTLSSECAYWGDASGPQAPDNPEGEGDEAIGNVDFAPYRTDPVLTSCVVPEYSFVG